MNTRRPRSRRTGKRSTTTSVVLRGRAKLGLAGVLAAGGLAVAVAGPVATSVALGARTGVSARPAADSNGANSVGTASAEFSGSVYPNGQPTTAHFEYGIDQRYRPPGYTGGVYDQATSDQQVGGGFQYVTVTASVTGLIPNAVYHMRLVATNNQGTAYGPDETFTTLEDPAPGAPVLGQNENVTPSGSVFFFVGQRQVPLTEPRQLPAGTRINSLRGSAKLVAATGTKGHHYSGSFKGGVFKFSQTRTGANKGLTTVALLDGASPGTSGYASCKRSSGRAAAHAALSARVLQTLHASASGRFRLRGRYAVGTVRGTRWSVSDRCDGTLISVQLHSVLVQDLVKNIAVLISAGHSYLAKAP
jgi:hypothetical protein